MKTPYVLVEIATMILGCYLLAFGVNTFLIPTHLLAGGLTGICQIFNFLFGWSVGLQYFLFNVPILLIGYFYIGKKFLVYTIFAVAVSSVFFDLVPVKSLWTEDVMLASIFGAIFSSMGGAIILRAGGSVGGLDSLSRVIAKYSNISIANIGLIVSVIIVAISAFIYDVQSAMFTIVSLYVAAKTYDVILNHAKKISVIVVTEKGEEVSSVLNRILHRGVTNWDAIGTYSQKKRKVLLCVIVNQEWALLCREVQKIDPGAFISSAYSQKLAGNFKRDW